MNWKFADYDGPTGMSVATGAGIVPIDSAEGMTALSHSTMLTSLGASPAAAKYQTVMAGSIRAAHDADQKFAYEKDYRSA